MRPSPARKDEFRRWGFRPYVQPAGGVLQLIAVALLIPTETVAYGAGLLLGMMIFSLYVHTAIDYQPRQLPSPLLLAVLAVITAFLYGGAAAGPVGEVFRAWFG